MPHADGTVRAVLFDLDGTFADTAPDMCHALNGLLARHGRDPLDVSAIRAYVSRGARGMLDVGFGLKPEDLDYAPLRDAFLDIYEQRLCADSRWFDGMEALVDSLEARGLKWGIVTNKARRFGLPLTSALGIAARAGCVVCGDTTPHAKPHPAPLLHAAQLLGVPPRACLYVGDDRRDMEAANAAGMRGVVACYGYVGDADVATWGAAHLVSSPGGLEALLT